MAMAEGGWVLEKAEGGSWASGSMILSPNVHKKANPGGAEIFSDGRLGGPCS